VGSETVATSALALAVINAHYELAALLLEKGADPNAPDARGSVLHAVAWMRRILVNTCYREIRRDKRRLRFELHGHAEHLGRPRQLVDDPADHRLAVADLVLTQVDDRKHGLVGEQEEGSQPGSLVVGEAGSIDGCTAGQPANGLLQQIDLAREAAVELGRLASPLELRLGALEIGDGQLELERAGHAHGRGGEIGRAHV